MSQLKVMLIRHEGMTPRIYTDTVGKITGGVGRNLTDCGFSQDEMMLMLENDITRARNAAGTFPWFVDMDGVRQDVILDMLFNLGLERFSGFKRLIAALATKDYPAAASEMLSSTWAVQVGSRATELAEMMRSGLYPA